MCLQLFYHKLSELKGESILNGTNISTLKKEIEILVIDDNEFPFLTVLQQYEFNIKQKNDLTHLSDVAEFDIILCDIRGVGKFLESNFEGANLIKELKTKYPSKIIIAYTANDYDATFQQYLNFADSIVPKGSFSVEDWVSLLTKTLYECVDPSIQWKRTRTALLNAGVSTVEVAKYESQYVKAVKSGSFESINKLYGKKNNEAAKIMVELASSILAKLIRP